jgi:hypothetical protein
MSKLSTAERREELHRAIQVKGISRFSRSAAVRGKPGCRALATTLCKGTVLGGSRRFLGFRLELLPRPRRLETADVARNPGGTRVGLMTSLQSDVLSCPRHTGRKPVTLLR